MILKLLKLYHRIAANYYSELIKSLCPEEQGLKFKYELLKTKHENLYTAAAKR